MHVGVMRSSPKRRPGLSRMRSTPAARSESPCPACVSATISARGCRWRAFATAAANCRRRHDRNTSTRDREPGGSTSRNSRATPEGTAPSRSGRPVVCCVCLTVDSPRSRPNGRHVGIAHTSVTARRQAPAVISPELACFRVVHHPAACERASDRPGKRRYVNSQLPTPNSQRPTPIPNSRFPRPAQRARIGGWEFSTALPLPCSIVSLGFSDSPTRYRTGFRT
jgi:hypothetical protein